MAETHAGAGRGGDFGPAAGQLRTSVYLSFYNAFEGANSYELGNPYVVNTVPINTGGPNSGIVYQGDVTQLEYPLDAADQEVVHQAVFAYTGGETDLDIHVEDMLPGPYRMLVYTVQYNGPPKSPRDYNVNFQEGATVRYVDLSGTNAVKVVKADVNVPDIGDGTGTAKILIEAVNDYATVAAIIIN